MKKIFFGFAVALIMASCANVHTSESHYLPISKMTEEQQSKFLVLGPDQAINTNQNSQIQIINGLQLRDLMTKENNAVVYLWSPDCHKDNCPSIDVFISSVKTRGYSPYVVMDFMNTNVLYGSYQNFSNVFAINKDYYKTNNNSKAKLKFLTDATNGKFHYDPGLVRFLLYMNGKFYNAFESFMNIH